MLRVTRLDASRNAPAAVIAGVLAFTFCFLFLGSRCLGERAPSRPGLGGPSSGQPGDTLVFRACATDPDGGNLSYRFDWADGSTENWTAELAGGDTFFRVHSFADSGTHDVRVRCRDNTGLESDWSVPLRVQVAYAGPLPPGRPAGPSTFPVDTAMRFTTTAGHLRGDSVSCRFDWSGEPGAWTGYVPPGTTVGDTHRFANLGIHVIRAQARDRAGNMSPWSVPETLLVTLRPLVAPHNLRLSTVDGVALDVRWTAGRDGDSTDYELWFRTIGSTQFQSVVTTRGSGAYHDPAGMTGDYTVSARRGEEEVFAPETVSTVPVLTDSLLLYELNAAGDAGYGWDSIAGTGAARSMLDSAQAPLVDFYFTDHGVGSNGPGYYIASPRLGPEDPGGVVPAGAWRRSGLMLLWGRGQEPLPEYDTLLYEEMVDVSVLETWMAAYTADGHYAVVNTLNPNPDSATVEVRTWFQRVRGLRLLRHAEGN